MKFKNKYKNILLIESFNFELLIAKESLNAIQKGFFCFFFYDIFNTFFKDFFGLLFGRVFVTFLQ